MYWNCVEPGEPGEVLVRGPLVTQGYYDNPTATKESFHDDWFCTGDRAVDRGGKFYIVDRKNELIKYKGLQTVPANLENTSIRLLRTPKFKRLLLLECQYLEVLRFLVHIL